MYTREQPNPGTAKLQLGAFLSPLLSAFASLRLCVNSLSPTSAYSAYSAVKKSANQNRTESEPKSNRLRITVDYQHSKVNQKRIKSEPTPNQNRHDSEPSAQKIDFPQHFSPFVPQKFWKTGFILSDDKRLFKVPKMNSLWSDAEAANYPGDLGQRVYTSRLLGRETALVLHG